MMNMVTHILKKDIHRTRILLAAWLALLALQFVLLAIRIDPSDQAMESMYNTISRLQPFLQTLLLIVIVPMAIQEEPLVGTTAFWFTRPISRADLLKSKTWFALLVLTLPPLAMDLIFLAANGATSHDIGLAAPEILMDQLALILCVGALAAVTLNFGRLAVVGVIGIVALTLLQQLEEPIARVVAQMRSNQPMAQGFDSLGLAHSRQVVSLLLLITAVAALIVHQYLSRKTARTFAGIVIAMALTLAVGVLWPWNIFKTTLLPASAPGFEASAINLWLTGRVSVSEYSNGQRNVGKQVKAQIQTYGMPEAYLITCQRVESRLTAPSGNTLQLTRTENAGSGMEADAIRAALGGPVIISPGDQDGEAGTAFITFAMLDSGTFAEYPETPFQLSANLDFVASKYVVTGEMPLAAGSRYDHGADHLVITDVLHEPGRMDIDMRQKSFYHLFAPDPDARFQEAAPKVVYVLLNRKRGEAFMQTKGGYQMYVGGATSIQQMTNTMVHLTFGREKYNQWQRSFLTPEWLADATLVRLDLTPVAEFSKEIADDHFMWGQGEGKPMK
jgi:hypothetical protein